ncbi:hypothetical protein CEUSTIGMA_g4218.t1 [Chlamydomonas eustigma]|uniref:Uncharacterized protein n=1 Tax=Chlamydomonas eustigma TaxID=1157962 RepID=A0A250X1K5_9CHLO|nr:hypothetical protein CEUSTIGMA_g4218.t1 [Chlamydomonas eustigma]|eukprot:GAX76772.1 hypothetical protein CEUSTIGMA_g4218.t1 [Chlamydomonas eustigma]
MTLQDFLFLVECVELDTTPWKWLSAIKGSDFNCPTCSALAVLPSAPDTSACLPAEATCSQDKTRLLPVSPEQIKTPLNASKTTLIDVSLLRQSSSAVQREAPSAVQREAPSSMRASLCQESNGLSSSKPHSVYQAKKTANYSVTKQPGLATKLAIA